MIVYFLRGGKLFGKEETGYTGAKNNETKLKLIEKKKLELTPEIFCHGLPI
jgi:hypothetical protein